MSNEKIIRKFLELKEGKTPTRDIVCGVYIYKGNTLRSYRFNDTMHLINYDTLIAKIDIKTNTLYVNTLKYSVTTSKIQSLILRLASNYNYQLVKVDSEL